ncbi:hypothetical protein L915_02115 [Phytophthora nicotianae]|uniref:EF-hand domain-containing protein n=3 Tax=Phytophthora nicotianae TaxID=4792 RepID=W2HHZ8_PHYNI|nr:hypothetical protein L915_02115 [Phytophthora nicotianae]ETL48279.1 hypothetical protein L916_02079 [Phytophthora nicotianae]
MALRRRAATAMRMGSVGALLPLLTVAGASAIANRREALNASLKSQKSASECLTTTASLAFQGLKSGLAWTIAVDAYAMTSVTDAELARYMATRPGCSVAGEIARKLGPLCMRNVLGFAGFLGLFGGVSCSLEVLRSKNDLLNPFVGGFTAGLVFLQQEFPKPRTHLTSAIVCGVFAMAIHHLIPAISKESESEDVAAVETRRWTMRQRRHVNGNSNALASTNTAENPSSSSWGSGRTVPVNIMSTSKRVAPPVVPAEHFTPTTINQGNTRGVTIPRRPQSSRLPSSRDHLAPCRPKRRVQSARGASEKNNQSNDAYTVLQSIGDNTLPKLQHQIGDLLNTKTRSSYSLQKPTPPESSAPTSGTDGKLHVQWAVKVSTAPTVQDLDGNSPEPTEMSDLRRLLQDRYGEIRSARQAFLAWDANRDGRICAKELRDMLSRLGIARVLGQMKVNVILQHVLARPTASLDYEDFFGVVYGPREQNQAALSSSNRQTANYTGPEEDTDSTADSDCVVSLLRSKYESHKVHQVFRDWDIDKNGGVTLAEIESNLRRQGLRISKPELMKLFDTYDLDRDGRLLYDEFKRLVYGPVHEPRYSYLAEQHRQNAHKQPMHERDSLEFFRKSTVPEQSNHSIDNPRFRATLKLKLKEFAARLNDAYAEFDDDHNGYLSYSELCVGLKELGLNLTEREFLHLATRVDADGNGEICFKEFCHVFGSDGAVNRRCQSARTGDEEDKRVEEKSAKTQLKHGSQRQRAAGTFNFSHLTRRAKTPTRCGRTPYPDTRGIISDNQGDTTNPARFMTESQLYGSASTSRSIPIPAKVITTLGQEEKQRLDAAKANRLQRLRVQMELYEDQARPLQDSYNVAQERRVRTLQRHRERYHQRIEQRPRYAQSPARKGIQILRASSTAPIV